MEKIDKDIKTIATKDLEEELARRRKEEEEASARLLLLQQERQQKLITIEFIDAFAPRHYRTSCNDNTINNGFGSTENGKGYRCLRCALVEVANGSFNLVGSDITFSIE